MAYTESITSREYNVTADGISFIRKFTCDWVDWNTGVFPYRVGYSLASDPEWYNTPTFGLYITHISATYKTPTVADVVLLYSTEKSRSTLKKQPDTKYSWEENFDIGLLSEPVDSFIDKNGDEQSWAELWAANVDNSALSAPTLLYYQPESSYSLTVYSSTLYIWRMLGCIGLVNSDFFLRNYFLNDQQTGIVSDIPGDADDKECWLFVGCPITRIRYDCWEYRMRFILCHGFNSGWTWNKPYGITVDLYDTISFSGTLLEGMRGIDTPSLPLQG